MWQRASPSPLGRLEVEKLRTLHPYESILSLVVNESLLGIDICSVKILQVVAAECEANEADKSTSRCNEEYPNHMSACTFGGSSTDAVQVGGGGDVLVLPPVLVGLPCDDGLAKVLGQVFIGSKGNVIPCFVAASSLGKCPFCLEQGQAGVVHLPTKVLSTHLANPAIVLGGYTNRSPSDGGLRSLVPNSCPHLQPSLIFGRRLQKTNTKGMLQKLLYNAVVG
jgi:hypothetical protein